MPAVEPLTGRPSRFEGGLRELGPGTFAWLQPNGAWGEANAGLLVGSGASLIVDTLWDEALARVMLASMQVHLRRAPVRVVFNSHSDGDHWWGNAAMPAEAEIITSEPSHRTMNEEAPPSELARTARLARAGAWMPGKAGALAAYLADMLGPFEFAGVRVRLPERTFSGVEALEVGGRSIRLIEVGPAHTPGDSVVHVPDAGVVFAADVLFVDATPVMWFGPIEGWLSALETLLSLDAETYVPGHGPPGNRTTVLELRDYLTWVDATTRQHHGAGRDPLQAARAMIASSDFDRWRGWECPERIVITVTTAYRHLDGQGPVGLAPLARARLFAQVATLRRELYRG